MGLSKGTAHQREDTASSVSLCRGSITVYLRGLPAQLQQPLSTSQRGVVEAGTRV